MDPLLVAPHFDLVTPDGRIETWDKKTAVVRINGIASNFKGFEIDSSRVLFNLKSSLAQVGVNAQLLELELKPAKGEARARVAFTGVNPLGQQMLQWFAPGMYVGKLFAADERRRVRTPEYMTRMFSRSDRFGKPLLSLGGLDGSGDMLLEVIDGRLIAYLSTLEGVTEYAPTIEGFIPTIAKALQEDISVRELLKLHQVFQKDAPRIVRPGNVLLLRTIPLHVRTVFGRVVDELLPEGVNHTSAAILQPDTQASGDIYEFVGSSQMELTDIPLEFYTLEPHKEHVFFCDRDQLLASLEDPAALFKAMHTSPSDGSTATFAVKGSQLNSLTEADWIVRHPLRHEFPGVLHSGRQTIQAEKAVEQQPAWPILKAIQEGTITSQGVLLCKYFPSPLLKAALLQAEALRCVKGIYFQIPSLTWKNFFSHEDRAMLNDLSKFGIPVYWVDEVTQKILQFVQKPDRDAGMFVPLDKIETYLKATLFGVYGSNLLEGNFEEELTRFFEGLIKMPHSHPHLSKDLALVTGGGPGAMEVGNRVAKKVGILSCGNIVDFSRKDGYVREQDENPHIEAKMTYRIEKLVERQAEFNLDYPIFLMGGIGTDFELALEELRRKVGTAQIGPILLFGPASYWRDKITSKFQSNRRNGTIQGSEWISNCFYAVENAHEALKVFELFLSGNLPIGKGGPIFEEGFVTAKSL